MGLFVSFEGGEGSGKSTQAKRLAARLQRSGYSVTLTYEPGGTPLGEELRRSLKKARETDIAPETELFLFAAARTQLTREVILPALAQGGVVVCDRFSDSTTAYQGYGRQLPLDLVAQVNEIASRGLRPDLVVLLDMAPSVALQRKKQPPDRFEFEGLEFHDRVRSGYLHLAHVEPGRWLVLDANQSEAALHRAIWSRVSAMLAESQSQPSA
jgi:dTMP kinase